MTERTARVPDNPSCVGAVRHPLSNYKCVQAIPTIPRHGARITPSPIRKSMNAPEYSSDRTHDAGWGWWHQGSCRGSNTDMFFAPDDREQRTVRARRERRAKQICQDCPVLRECRTHALTAAERYGIWGRPFRERTCAPHPSPPAVPVSRIGHAAFPLHQLCERAPHRGTHARGLPAPTITVPSSHLQ